MTREDIIEKAERLRKGYDMADSSFAIQLWADTAADFVDCVLRYFSEENQER